jgi:4-carboxymuconolactone decarboxylase
MKESVMRVPLVDPDSCPPEVREALAGLPDMRLFRLAAHADTVFEPWRAYLSALHTSLELDPRLRELAILQVAHEERSDYERVQHEVIARLEGVDEDQIRSIADGRDPADPPAATGAVRRVARDVARTGTAGEEAVTELVAAVGLRQAVELVLLIGQYIAIARLLKTFDVPADEPVVSSRH